MKYSKYVEDFAFVRVNIFLDEKSLLTAMAVNIIMNEIDIYSVRYHAHMTINRFH